MIVARAAALVGTNARRGKLRVAAVVVLCLLLDSCNSAHALDVVGAYFPFWLLSMLIGVVAAFASRYLFVRLKIEPYLSPLTITYLCVMISVACLTWLLFT